MGATKVTIDGSRFLINGRPTYEGQPLVEGLLMNSRMVQGIFDDANPMTRAKWSYPDGPWDPDRNTADFIDAMPQWRRHGLISFTINLQGGNPEGYGRDQPWINSAFTETGQLKQPYMDRLDRILLRADELGMVPILGYFYFGQEPKMDGEEAVLRGARSATEWIVDRGYRNLLVEVANESNSRDYRSSVLHPDRAHELIQSIREWSGGNLLVSTSFWGGVRPSAGVVCHTDYILLHGNGVEDPADLGRLIDDVRSMPEYRYQPIVVNEDDHFRFDEPMNNMMAAIRKGAGWGYFDYRMAGESFDDGYQSVPVNWQISSKRKRAFFSLLSRITGHSGSDLT